MLTIPIQKSPTQKVSGLSEISEKALLLHNLLVDLLTLIKFQGYKFTTVTPTTHEHYLQGKKQGNNLRDIFGWNLPFSLDALSPALKKIMFEANIIEAYGELWYSKVRISSLGNDLFLHSAFPTTGTDAVFFGPDTYRFARFIRHCLEKDKAFFDTQQKKPLRILDIGCGTGAGGIAAIRALPEDCAYELIMNDINNIALDLTVVNAQAAGVPVKLLKGDIFETLKEKFDLIISNPPYMNDESGRLYRDGGDQLGLALSIRLFKKAIQHLAPGGKLIMYTGVAMSTPTDPFISALAPLLVNINCSWSYEEIDPDIFGEELRKPFYSNAYRIAAVGLVVNLFDT